LKTPVGKMKQRSKSMGRTCKSSWTRAHEKFSGEGVRCNSIANNKEARR
jgi:hypothetical protein